MLNGFGFTFVIGRVHGIGLSPCLLVVFVLARAFVLVCVYGCCS